MNLYKGLKSSDAEIILDLEKGKVFFDYSLNKLSNPYESNYSCVLSRSGNRDLGLKDFINFYYYSIISSIIILPFLTIISPHFPKYQYKWQKFLKSRALYNRGMQIQTSIGKLQNTTKEFHIENNIWFDYELDGEYKEKIKKISLLRHFIIKERCGLTKHTQWGWDVVFEFKEPPNNGYCVLRSLL